MLELPATVLPSWLVTLAAGHRPLGDVEEMRRLATAWRDVQRSLEKLANEVAATYGGSTEEGLTGVAEGLTGVAAAESLAEREQRLRELAEYAGSLADQLLDAALAIEFQQLTVDITVWVVALQVAYSVVFPHGALLALAARLWAQKTLKQAFVRHVARLLLEGAEYVAKRPLLAVPLQGGGSGALEGTITDLLAQRTQIREGNREAVDRRSVWVSTASGAAGGMAGDAGARWVAPAIGRASEPVARVAGVGAGRAVHVLALGAAGGVFGAPAGMAVSMLANGVNPFEATAEEWQAGLVEGIGGGVIGAAGHALRSTAPPLPVPSSEPVQVQRDPVTGPKVSAGSEDSPGRPVADALNSVSALPTVATRSPAVTPWADSGSDAARGQQHSLLIPSPELPEVVRTGPASDESQAAGTTDRKIEQAPADTSPRTTASDQPGDHRLGDRSTRLESTPTAPLPASEPAETTEPGPRTDTDRLRTESTTPESSTTTTSEPPQTAHPAATAGAMEDTRAPGDRIPPITPGEARASELTDAQLADESTAQGARTRLDPAEAATPGRETADPELLAIVAAVPGPPAPRPVADSTAVAPRSSADSPDAPLQTKTPDTRHNTGHTSSPNELPPRVVAPGGTDQRPTTTNPTTVTAPTDPASTPPLLDRSTTPTRNTPGVETVAATTAPQHTSPPTTRPGDNHTPGITERLTSSTTATPEEPPHAPETAISPESALDPVPYAIDVHAHQRLDEQRTQLFATAENSLFNAEQSLRTLWTPPIEQQLAEIGDPSLQANTLRQRLDALRDKGLSRRQLDALDTVISRALDTHREIGAAVRADRQNMQHILRAYADDPTAEPTWRNPRSTEPDPPCSTAITVALRALFPHRDRTLPNYAPNPKNSRPTPPVADSAVLGHLLGNRPEDVGSGPEAHKSTVARLSEPDGERPMPGRGPGAIRRAVVIHDGRSTDPDSDSGHTYLAALLNNGELVRLDLSRDAGPRRLDPPADNVVVRKIYVLDRNGYALPPRPSEVPHSRIAAAAGEPRSPEDRHRQPHTTPDQQSRINKKSDDTTVTPLDPAEDNGTGDGKQETRVEAIAAPVTEPGLRGWFLRMHSSAVGRLMFGSLLTSLGAASAGYSAALAVGILTGSPLLAVIPVVARNIANFISTIPAGIASDRFDQRRVVIASSLVGLGATLGGSAAITLSLFGLLTPGIVAIAVGAVVFTHTAMDSFADRSQERYAQRFAQNKSDSEQREVGKLDLLQGQIAGMMGNFLGPALTGLSLMTPFLVASTTFVYNLRIMRKVRLEFGEPPLLGQADADRTGQQAQPIPEARVNETDPRTTVNKKDPGTKVEPVTSAHPDTVRDNATPLGRRDDEPASDDERPGTPDGPTEDESPEAVSATGAWGRFRHFWHSMGSAFGSVWPDPYLRGVTLLVTPIGAIASGLQATRLVEHMVRVGGWEAGGLAAMTGLSGIAGFLLAKKVDLTVKEIWPRAMAIWALVTIPAAFTVNPIIMGLSVFPAAVMGTALDNKFSDYRLGIDKKRFGGERLGRMKSAHAFTFNIGITTGNISGGYILSNLGLGVTGFVQAGVASVAAVVAGFFGFRHRNHNKDLDRPDRDS